MIKDIPTGGISYLEPLTGSNGWYWGTDYTSGDLYEAEELYRSGHRISRNRLILVRFPEGRVAEPIEAKEGQYFGRPGYDGRDPLLLLADFPAGEVRLIRYHDETGETSAEAVLPLSELEDCYNLMPHRAPLMLTRQTGDRFQIIWPDRADFAIVPQESFCFREGDRLYFSRWYEDPDYREEVVIRRFPDGAVIDQFRGALQEMPDGSWYRLREDRP